jgi:hypothetical protein
VLLRLHFLRYGKEREVLLSSQDLAAVSDELKARIEVIEADHTFTPGSFCGWCRVTAHCPVMAKALTPVEVMAPTTREQAEKAASLLLTLQKMEKELATCLKEWVRAQGAIQVGDLVYGASITTSYDLDPRAVVQFLLEAGLEREAIWPLLNLTKTGRAQKAPPARPAGAGPGQCHRKNHRAHRFPQGQRGVMKIIDITIRQFLGLESLDLHLQAPINVIIGENEAGKSSIRDAIQWYFTGQAWGL